MDILSDTNYTTTTDGDDNASPSASSSWRDQLIHWCVHRQVGGMQGRPNKAEDTCYSYWIGGSLRLLGQNCDDLLDHHALRQFILVKCQNAKIGGFSKIPKCYPDILHSFYSLAWLSLSNKNYTTRNKKDDDSGEIGGGVDDDESHKLPLHELNCTLGIRQERAAVFFRDHPVP
jgi:prenyltransferase beta subunit